MTRFDCKRNTAGTGIQPAEGHGTSPEPVRGHGTRRDLLAKETQPARGHGTLRGFDSKPGVRAMSPLPPSGTRHLAKFDCKRNTRAMSPGLLAVKGFDCKLSVRAMSPTFPVPNIPCPQHSRLMVKTFCGQKMKSTIWDQVSIRRLPFFDQLIF